MAKAQNPRHGEQHPNAVLSDDDVRTIRLRSERGESNADLARAYKTSPQNVSMIVARKRRGRVI